MGASGNSGGAARQRKWRPGAVANAREIKSAMQWVVGRLVGGGSSLVYIHASKRAAGDPYQRPREWGEYVENNPEHLASIADELDAIARACMALRRSVLAQRDIAERGAA